jgi:hypothetical protein
VIQDLEANGLPSRAAVISLAKGLVPPHGRPPTALLNSRFGAARSACVGGLAHAREMVSEGAGLVAASTEESLATGVLAAAAWADPQLVHEALMTDTRCLRTLKPELPPLRANAKRKGETMPQIIVTADQDADRREDAVMLRERVNASDFESEHFAARLVERLGWAVGDAHDAERRSPSADPQALTRSAP